MKDQDYILFEEYLSKILPLDDVEAFEARLKTDLEFNESFNFYKELSSYLEHKFKNEEASKSFQENLQSISNNHFNKTETTSNIKEKSKTFNLYKYAIAASIALLLGIFALNQFSNPTYNDYADYGSISLTVRGSNNELLNTAEHAFNSGNYAKAEDAFRNLIKLDENNSELKLYRAITNIELNDYEMADKVLEDLRRGNSVYKNKATWYLALSKLKQKDNKACIDVLKTISEDADDYKQAKKLLRQLD
ncbi:hypothetical protein A8C32_11030 [Flavivirga aquatica]|uniref:Tetratricopeptide repeat protein n=1 Tax=Flavivirga aquatica TaxID=1849968 RepID=A0A1E5TCZ8_9FLAO|nr:hypothetical protein [Flavivirga aquatica]OEK09252.1 hypothetical protein A8C32_11030 [Flavivirga aquatica]